MHAIFLQGELIGEVTASSSRDDRCEPVEMPATPRPVAESQKNADYDVRIADSEAIRAAANQLVHDRYSARGYRVSNQSSESQHELTVVVLAGQTICGTATLRVDSALGVGADAIFKDHVDVFRHEGARVCEITRFAVGRGVDSKIVISAAFHFLYIVGYYMRRCTHVFIEVNPRHSRFYEMVYGFERRSDVRINPRVNAPAQLMQVTADYLATRIYPSNNHSNFPCFYSALEEQAIRTKFANVWPLEIGFRPPIEVLTEL